MEMLELSPLCQSQGVSGRVRTHRLDCILGHQGEACTATAVARALAAGHSLPLPWVCNDEFQAHDVMSN